MKFRDEGGSKGLASYENFARVYDRFMDNIDYDSWCSYLIRLLQDRGITDGLVLELGCGTGNVTGRLCRAGYDMIGVDNAPDMLQIAMEKAKEEGQDILYLLQDMCEFELYGTVRAVVSLCDSMNYLLEEEELCRVFSLVNNYLDPGGVFIFDLNTRSKYEAIGEDTIAEVREDAGFVWENYFDPETDINEYDLTLFIRGEDGRYDRYDEVHRQRAYTLDRVKTLLEESGLIYVTAYDAFTLEPAHEECDRVYIIAREKGKENV